MKFDFFRYRASVAAGALLITAGLVLGVWAMTNLPIPPGAAGRLAILSPLASGSPPQPPAQSSQQTAGSSASASRPALGAGSVSPLAAPDDETSARLENGLDEPSLEELGTKEIESDAEPAGDPTLVIGLGADLPPALLDAVFTLDAAHDAVRLSGAGAPTATVSLRWDAEDGVPFYRQVFAAASRLDVSEPALTWEEIQSAWNAGAEPADEDEQAEAVERFEKVVYLEGTLPALRQLLGDPGAQVSAVADREAAIAAAWVAAPTLVLLPFEELHPRLTVFAVDGQNPVENAAHFNAHNYALTAILYIQGHMTDARLGREQAVYLQALPNTNRDPNRLTVIAATGVTAMTRLTAAEMETRGYGWPAEVVGPELAAADITLISNEVPFIEGCEPNTAPDNLVFCSKPEYMETLLASGVTVVGLTGNHQNDFGRQGMYDTLAVYAEHGIPVYGGGATRDEATAPLYLEHNGNRLAFVGVNSYGPPSAWATEIAPGSAPYDLAILSTTIRNIKEQDLADLVLAEFQYQESYDVEPLWEQRSDFRAVVRAGADIVTGVQSHVPQALEFFNPALPPEPVYSDDRLILYGLGNLYFDQMWTEATRDNLIAKHTVYAGRHLSTQLLTTVLHDYGQPRWADADRRRAILERVFAASGFGP